MLGLSLSKVLVLALIVAIIWQWSKGLRKESESSRENSSRGGSRGQGGRGQPDTETLVACPVCKAYVVQNGAKPCGRSDCPYKG